MTPQTVRTARDWMGLPARHAESHHARPLASVAPALALVAALLFLGGCGFTPQGDLIRDVVKQSTQKAGEAGLQNAIWFLCEAAPVGAVKRMYGGEKADAYVKLCEAGSAGGIIAPVAPVIERSGG